MATFSLPTPSANYNGGQPAIGTEVRADIESIRTFIIGPNLNQDNFADIEGVINFRLTTNVQAINLQSEAETINEVSLRRLATIGVGGDPVDEDEPIFDVAAGSGQGDRSDRMFEVAPNFTVLAPRKTQAERDAIPSPRARMVVYNTDEERYDYYDGTSWLSMAGLTTAPVITTGSFQTVNHSGSGSFAALTQVTVTIQRQGICTITFQGQGSGSSGISFTQQSAPGNVNPPTVTLRVTRNVNGGGDVLIHEYEWKVDDPYSSGNYPDRLWRFPASMMNTVDNLGALSDGDSVVYALQARADTAIASSQDVRTVVKED